MSALERIAAKVEIRYASSEDVEGPCWVWGGKSKNKGGYGRAKYGSRTTVVHRIMWMVLVGPIEDDLTLDHLCRVRDCCNPDHLEPVTGQVNTLRGLGPTAQNAQLTECRNGHPFSDTNTRIETGGRRRCRICQRERDAKRDHSRSHRRSRTLQNA